MKVRTKIIDKTIGTPALQYAKQGDAGIDLTATSKTEDEFGNVVYGTNRAFEIPEGYVGLIFPRSSVCKQDLMLTNAVGCVDSGYRGEVFLKMKTFNTDKTISRLLYTLAKLEVFEGENLENVISSLTEDSINFRTYEVGDRIGQLIILPYPTIEFEESDDLSETERGDQGYGSSGN